MADNPIQQSFLNANACVIPGALDLPGKRCNTFTRQRLITEELESIIQDTNSKGRTLDQTLSRVLQDLRDEGFLTFMDNEGLFRLNS